MRRHLIALLSLLSCHAELDAPSLARDVATVRIDRDPALDPRATTKLHVTPDAVWVETVPPLERPSRLALRDGGFPNLTAKDYLVEELLGVLRSAAARTTVAKPFDATLTLHAAGEVPYATVVRAIYTAGQADFTTFEVAVRGPTRAGVVRVALPKIDQERSGQPVTPCALPTVTVSATSAPTVATILATDPLPQGETAALTQPRAGSILAGLLPELRARGETLCASAVVLGSADTPWASVARVIADVAPRTAMLATPAE